MDMSLLKNKIVIWVAGILSILAVIITILYPTLSYKFTDDPYLSLLYSYYWVHFLSIILALIAMLVYTLTLPKNFFGYFVSYLFFNPVIFQIHYMIFGIVGDNEVKRTFMRILGIILAILWVQIAKKIREKV